MTKNSAALLPIMRGETQARLLAALLLRPGREASMSELAGEVGTNVGNLHGEVERLVEAGILADRRVGRTRLIRDAGGPFSRPLTEMLTIAYGPRALLEEALHAVAGIDAAYLFGSWAARYGGEPGPAPNDIDLLVIGDPDRDDIVERTGNVGRQIGREVQVVFRSRQSWQHDSDGFVRTVRTRPLVKLETAAA